ncbi:MAG: cysteine--tRNA ligase [Bacilli bacterium]|nr:cysteine--tRNA ligase [Bacilli bacterium]
MIRIYNSLTNRMEAFKPIRENEVSMYVCGSTVYDNIHIGNSRPVVFFDTVARFFTFLGYQVKFVSNFTDIDDKIIRKAKQEETTETVISERYIASILDTYRALNCLPHYKNPKVTETIPEIVQFIELLVEKKGAYVVDGDVYFAIDQVADYGILSGQTKEKLIVGARIEENEKKENPIDFNLWKKTEEGLRFPSPWSEGRPGWHTECVVMINSIFHGPIDIHGGGLDLKFPHHDNEIAQAEVAFNHHIANIWMHNGRIDMAGEKMSKSLGNIIWAHDLVRTIGYQVYRLLLLNVPYGQPMTYRPELITQAETDLDKMMRPYIALKRKLQLEKKSIKVATSLTDASLKGLHQEFVEAMSNDFNTANAITVLFKVAKLLNSMLRSPELNETLASEVVFLFEQLTWVLGIEKALAPLTEEEIDLVRKWQQARQNKDFQTADHYREAVSQLGVFLS